MKNDPTQDDKNGCSKTSIRPLFLIGDWVGWKYNLRPYQIIEIAADWGVRGEEWKIVHTRSKYLNKIENKDHVSLLRNPETTSGMF